MTFSVTRLPRYLGIGLTALLLTAVLALVTLLWLVVAMPGQSRAGDWRDDARLPALQARLYSHVEQLAGVIGPRHYSHADALDASVEYLSTQLERLDYEPELLLYGEGIPRHQILRVTLSGSGASGELLVVGAHYDSVAVSPGADDNASGVAVLLELARELKSRPLDRSLRLEFWPNEEQGEANMPSMGSQISAKHARQQDENIVGVLSLEMLGYYDDTAGTQHYPPVLRWFYPDTGDFIAFVANLNSRPFLHQALAAFRETQRFPSEGMAAPEWLVEDIRRSDHASYWRAGYPALMITDTANFRNPHYHRASDLPATLDYAAMARLTLGLAEMLEALAGAPTEGTH